MRCRSLLRSANPPRKVWWLGTECGTLMRDQFMKSGRMSRQFSFGSEFIKVRNEPTGDLFALRFGVSIFLRKSEDVQGAIELLRESYQFAARNRKPA